MRHSAFSLVELSIVLVILGLLVGGILAGQSLIHASELRSISADFTKYQTSLSAFRDKYFGWPGDIANATAFWGKDATNCNSASGNAAAPGTCNGNADSNIQAVNEWYRAWQQLAMAGLVEGQYAGTGNASTIAVAGVDIPASRLSNAGFSLYYTSQAGDGGFGNIILPDSYANWLYLGGMRNNGWASLPVLSPLDAWNIDTKIDDGLPFRGRLHAGQRTLCGAAPTNPDSAYLLTGTGLCAVAYNVY